MVCHKKGERERSNSLFMLFKEISLFSFKFCIALPSFRFSSFSFFFFSQAKHIQKWNCVRIVVVLASAAATFVVFKFCFFFFFSFSLVVVLVFMSCWRSSSCERGGPTLYVLAERGRNSIKFYVKSKLFQLLETFFEQFQATSCNIRKPRKFCAAKRAFHIFCLCVVIRLLPKQQNYILFLKKCSTNVRVFVWVLYVSKFYLVKIK